MKKYYLLIFHPKWLYVKSKKVNIIFSTHLVHADLHSWQEEHINSWRVPGTGEEYGLETGGGVFNKCKSGTSISKMRLSCHGVIIIEILKIN